MAYSTYLERKLLDFVFGSTAFSAPGTTYISLGQQTCTNTAPIAQGVAITTITCAGGTNHALVVGDVLLIGTNGEQAIVNAAAAQGAVSITIVSFTPCATYATGNSIVKVSAPVEPAFTNGYARVNFPNNTGNWPNATGSNPAVKQNGAPITFNGSTGLWYLQPLACFGIHDASTGGNLLAAGYLATPVIISGIAPAVSFPTGTMTIAET